MMSMLIDVSWNGNEELSIVNKCDVCVYLRDKGKNPACVDACPNRALDFGDLEELKAK